MKHNKHFYQSFFVKDQFKKDVKAFNHCVFVNEDNNQLQVFVIYANNIFSKFVYLENILGFMNLHLNKENSKL